MLQQQQQQRGMHRPLYSLLIQVARGPGRPSRSGAPVHALQALRALGGRIEFPYLGARGIWRACHLGARGIWRATVIF